MPKNIKIAKMINITKITKIAKQKKRGKIIKMTRILKITKINVNPTIWEDLAIFEPNGIFKSCNNTHTYFGFIHLFNTVVNPINEIPKLNRKITELINNNNLYQHSIDYLKNVNVKI